MEVREGVEGRAEGAQEGAKGWGKETRGGRMAKLGSHPSVVVFVPRPVLRRGLP